MFTVYRHINQKNGKSYIGITCQGMIVRWWGHCGDARRRAGMCRIFHAAIRKYGEDCWTHEILFESADRIAALKMETAMIEKYKTNDRNHGYNITAGGERGNYGLKMPPQVGEAISKRQRGKDNPCYQRVYSEAEKQRQSAKMKEWHKNNPHPRFGKKAPLATREKLRAARIGKKNHFYGKKHKSISLKKMSENNGCKGLWGWQNPCTKHNENALNLYARADVYFEWWKMHRRGADCMAQAFGEKRQKPHLTLIVKFREGWEPLVDSQWIEFKNARTLAA